MQKDSKIDWWRRRRFWWPVATAILLAGSSAWSYLQSNLTSIVVYNETGSKIEAITVSACGTAETFQDVNSRESVRLVIKDQGTASEIEVSTNGVSFWRGDYVEANGGYRAIVHLRHDGETESSVKISWWQRWHHSSPHRNEENL
jgi:hypothetical protein